MAGYSFGGGLGGINDGERVVECGEGAADGGLDEWVVSAAEKESITRWGFGEGFGEVDPEDFVGDWMVDPAFFYQGDEEGAGLFVGCEAEGVEGVGVGVGSDRCGGGEDQNVVMAGDLWYRRGFLHFAALRSK